jgi:hypothetical protein
MHVLAEIGEETAPNYAKKYELDRSTLSQRHRGKTTSRKEAISEHHQNLTTLQEQTLINHINRLTDRNIPPTAQIVQNVAKEMVGPALARTGQATLSDDTSESLKAYICVI